MDRGPIQAETYFCPMHRDIRRPGPGKCPKCGMDLLPEGTRFGMLRHMVKSPVMIGIMIAIVAAVMALLIMK